MKTSPLIRLWRPGLSSSRSLRRGYAISRPGIRQNSSLTTRNDAQSPVQPPPSKAPHSIFSDFGNPQANKPMFEQLALLTPAIIPEDPMGVIRIGDSAHKLLDHSALVMERRLEMLNVFLVESTEQRIVLTTGI
jgi:hypothetical protein